LEIRGYLESVAHHYNIRRHVQFGKAVTKCVWDEDTAKWTVTTSDGNTSTANFVIQCAGKLHVPLKPKLKGKGRK
jgi:cation diffusion facilitator CzcD-associated flavoprotein CzcO